MSRFKWKFRLLLKPSIAVDVVARTWEELAGFKAEWSKLGDSPLEVAKVTTGSAAIGAVGMAVGSSLALGSVTVAGSSTLGGVAVAIGLLTPPLWPALAMGALFTGLGYTAMKAGKFSLYRKKPRTSRRN